PSVTPSMEFSSLIYRQLTTEIYPPNPRHGYGFYAGCQKCTRDPYPSYPYPQPAAGHPTRVHHYLQIRRISQFLDVEAEENREEDEEKDSEDEDSEEGSDDAWDSLLSRAQERAQKDSSFRASHLTSQHDGILAQTAYDLASTSSLNTNNVIGGSLWKVSVKVGCEELATFALFNKYLMGG
ncbi:hypothetical protein H0H93_008775, partial [Arthromyces matolae]